MNSNYLVHWGIPGMKWGERRYQNPDGSLTEAGRIRYGKQQARQRSKNLAKARKAKAKKAKDAATLKKNKEQWAKDPLSMYRHRDAFSTKEIQAQSERFNAEQQLHRQAYDKVNRGRDYLTTASSMMSSVYNIYKTVDQMSSLAEGKKEKAEKPSLSYSEKQAQKILKDISNTALSDLDKDSLKEASDKISLVRAIEGNQPKKK